MHREHKINLKKDNVNSQEIQRELAIFGTLK